MFKIVVDLQTYPRITIIICHCCRNIKRIITYPLHHLIYFIGALRYHWLKTQPDRSLFKALIHVNWMEATLFAVTRIYVNWIKYCTLYRHIISGGCSRVKYKGKKFIECSKILPSLQINSGLDKMLFHTLSQWILS